VLAALAAPTTITLHHGKNPFKGLHHQPEAKIDQEHLKPYSHLELLY
jgi:hypothetical protein